jgi:hypothetical protein
MARPRSDSFTMTLRVVLSRPDVRDMPELEPVLTEQHLADPDESVDAAMDYALPRDGDPEILRQAQRCLLSYIGWLLDDAPARYPSWAKDELQRAIRRLVEVETAVESACPKLH